MCGRCCLHLGHHLLETLAEDHLDALEQTEIDWQKIVDFIKDRYGGVLKLRCDDGLGEISIHKINKIDDLPWWELDSSYCPFVQQKRDETGRFTTGFYCEIHDFKPAACREFPKDIKHAREGGCPGYD